MSTMSKIKRNGIKLSKYTIRQKKKRGRKERRGGGREENVSERIKKNVEETVHIIGQVNKNMNSISKYKLKKDMIKQ